MEKETVKFKPSFTTLAKGFISTGMLFGGAIGILTTSNPNTTLVCGLLLIYSYLLGLDARLSLHEEAMQFVLNPKKQDESNRQQTP